MKSDWIVFGDMLKYLPTIEDDAFDMILTDLPYGKTRFKFDSMIPLESMWREFNRVVKQDGAIVLTADQPFSSMLVMSNLKYFRYDKIWDKGKRGTGFLNAKKMGMRNHEHILVFYKKYPTFNLQMKVGEPLHAMGSKAEIELNKNSIYGRFDSTKNPSIRRAGDINKFPKSIMRFDRPHPPIYPFQKPLSLWKELILTYTNKNDTILDASCGSGTTAVACLRTQRHFCVIDINIKAINLTKRRVYKMMVSLSRDIKLVN